DQPVISPNGDYVVFRSTADNIVPGAGYGVQTNVFLWNSTGDTFQLVSHVTGFPTTAGNNDSKNGVISRNTGSSPFIAFESVAPNLVAGDTNGLSDVFRVDSSTGAIIRVSVPNLGGQANVGGSFNPAIDGAGDCIVYESQATNLVTSTLSDDGNGASDVFRWKQSAVPVTILLSHLTGSTTKTGSGASTQPSIDDTCGTFAFRSAATNLVFGQSDINGGTDVFWATNSGDAAFASHRAGLSAFAGTGISDAPILSRDGGFVAYASQAKDLVSPPGAPGPTSNVFLYDIGVDTNTLVSHKAADPATPASGQSFAPEISTNGLYVAFVSDAKDIDPNQNDGNGAQDVFLYNARWNNSVVASRRYASIAFTGDRQSFGPALSGFGWGVAFTSGSDNLIADDSETGGPHHPFPFAAHH